MKKINQLKLFKGGLVAAGALMVALGSSQVMAGQDQGRNFEKRNQFKERMAQRMANRHANQEQRQEVRRQLEEANGEPITLTREFIRPDGEVMRADVVMSLDPDTEILNREVTVTNSEGEVVRQRSAVGEPVENGRLLTITTNDGGTATRLYEETESGRTVTITTPGGEVYTRDLPPKPEGEE